MFPQRLGAFTQTQRPPRDFWPPQATREPASHARADEPAMLLRLAGVVAAIAIMIAAALVSA